MRNQQKFWYALYNATAEGYEDSVQVSTYPTYHNPVEACGNISAAKGTVLAQQFGDDDQYDKVIILGDRDTPIDEHSVLWIDSVPQLDANGALVLDANGREVTPYDYVVKRVGRGLPGFGAVSIAVSKVNVS